MVYAAKNLQRDNLWELPGGFVVRTQRFHYHGLGSIPDLGTKILQTAQQGQKKKKKTILEAKFKLPCMALESFSLELTPWLIDSLLECIALVVSDPTFCFKKWYRSELQNISGW